MKKLKKIFTSFGVFIIGLISKVSAASIAEIKYGVKEPEPTMEEKISIVGKFVIPIVLFAIGLFVILDKKIPKKEKAIGILVLIALAIFGVMLMDRI